MQIQLNVVMSTVKKKLSEMIRVIMEFMRMSGEIIQVRLKDVLNVMECIRNHSLKCSPNILKAKREIFIREGSPWTYKGCLILISQHNVYLAVTKKTVHKGNNSLPTHSLMIWLVKGEG